VDVDCDVIVAEYPTYAKIIHTIKRGADIETVKSYILAQENVTYDVFLLYTWS
jgi:hypothetical protein